MEINSPIVTSRRSPLLWLLPALLAILAIGWLGARIWAANQVTRDIAALAQSRSVTIKGRFLDHEAIRLTGRKTWFEANVTLTNQADIAEFAKIMDSLKPSLDLGWTIRFHYTVIASVSPGFIEIESDAFDGTMALRFVSSSLAFTNDGTTTLDVHHSGMAAMAKICELLKARSPAR